MGFGWRRRSRNTTNKVPPLEELVIPNHFLCPISLDVMRDPVTLSSGITYDRDSIEKWIHDGNFTCPVTKQTLTGCFDLIPNHTLRKMIQEWCVKNLQFGVERFPTPRVPVTPFEVSGTLSKLSESTRSGDLHGCMALVRKIKNWGDESERNKKCIVGNRAAETLAAAFEKFAVDFVTRHDSMLLGEILSVVDWMFPLDVETLGYFGRSSSVSFLVRFLETGDLSVRKTAALVLKELSCDPSHVNSLVEADGVLVKLIEQPISAAITKASLTIVFNLISSARQNEEIKRRFVDAGLVEILIETLVESERSVSEKTLAVLSGLCSSDEGRARAYGHSLTVPVLVKKILRVSELATGYSVSMLSSLIRNCNRGDQARIVFVIEMLQVGVFQKLLLLLQVDCGDETKEKVTDLLKLLNPYRAGIECIESVDFKNIKRSF